MIKRLKRVGNSSALILDKALMELIGLQENADVRISVHNGSLIIMPANPKPVDMERFEASLDHLVEERREVLRRLAQ